MPFRFFKKNSPKSERSKIEYREEDYQKERKFFLKYHGIGFFMAREGENKYDDYKAKNVPVELEHKWMAEYQADLKVQMEKESSMVSLHSLFYDYALTIGERCCSSEPLQYMLEFAVRNNYRLDSFSKILFAEVLLIGVKGYSYCKPKDPLVNEKVKQYAFKMLQNVIDNPVVVPKEIRNDPFMERYDFSDENLIQRARTRLSEWENK